MNDPYLNRPYRYPAQRRSVLPLCLFLLLGILIGVWVDRSGWLPGAPPSGLGSTFGEAWEIARNHYVDHSKADPEKMTQGAIEGMLDSLGDFGHTMYVTKDKWHEMENMLEGSVEGIGARISMQKGRATIASTIPGSPAEKAGLKPGDAIVAVDGESVEGLATGQIVAKVKGPAKTQVRLSIVHAGQTEPAEVTITRQKVVYPVVVYHALPGVPIGHIVIHDFAKLTDEELKAVVAEARNAGMKGLIIDMRDNTGGLRDQAVLVTSEFLKDGDVFIEQDGKGNRTAVPVIAGGVATDLPLVVLIDQLTASSAEIFAGAIQDHNRGKLIGTRTYGTGTVLQPFRLSDGSAVVLAVKQWLTPKGREIWHKGIEPDIKVALPEGSRFLMPESEGNLTAADLAKSTDAQVLRAIEELKKQIGP